MRITLTPARLAITAILVLCAVATVGFYFFNGSHVDFDAAVIAGAETRMWKAYYERNVPALRHEMKTLLRGQFGLSRWRTWQVSRHMSMAAATFAFGRGENAAKRALPSLEKAYAQIRRASGRDFDPGAAAQAELDWWAARRTPGRNSVEQVGQDIARLYAILYGESNPAIQEAGYLRALAAHKRDTGADWAEVEQLLFDSYESLLQGIEVP